MEQAERLALPTRRFRTVWERSVVPGSIGRAAARRIRTLQRSSLGQDSKPRLEQAARDPCSRFAATSESVAAGPRIGLGCRGPKD
jgi:hypothetical protein